MGDDPAHGAKADPVRAAGVPPELELSAILEVADAATRSILDSQSVRLFEALHRSDAAAEAKALSSLPAKLDDLVSPCPAMPAAVAQKVD